MPKDRVSLQPEVTNCVALLRLHHAFDYCHCLIENNIRPNNCSFCRTVNALNALDNKYRDTKGKKIGHYENLIPDGHDVKLVDVPEGPGKWGR